MLKVINLSKQQTPNLEKIQEFDFENMLYLGHLGSKNPFQKKLFFYLFSIIRTQSHPSPFEGGTASYIKLLVEIGVFSE